MYDLEGQIAVVNRMWSIVIVIVVLLLINFICCIEIGNVFTITFLSLENYEELYCAGLMII